MNRKNRFWPRFTPGPAVVFCVRCGSSKIDQPGLDRLVCENCHNSIAWDGLSFGIARCGGIVRALVRRTVMAAARRALDLRKTIPPWIDATEAERENRSGQAHVVTRKRD